MSLVDMQIDTSTLVSSQLHRNPSNTTVNIACEKWKMVKEKGRFAARGTCGATESADREGTGAWCAKLSRKWLCGRTWT
eukprot:12880895-Prorocentrum_lima.AAC.1